MKYVYIVSVGEYDDNQNVAAFSDEKKADAFANSCQGYVESLLLDTPNADPLIGKTIFCVHSKPKSVIADYAVVLKGYDKISCMVNGVSYKCYGNNGPGLYTYVAASDEAQAIKIAGERFSACFEERGFEK